MDATIAPWTPTELQMIAEEEARREKAHYTRKWYNEHPGEMMTAEDVRAIDGSCEPGEDTMDVKKTEIEIVPILLPILDAPEYSEYKTGMLHLGLSIFNAGVRTRALVIADCRRVGFVRAFNGGMKQLLSDACWDTPEDIEYTWRYVCLLSADLVHEQEGWLKRLIEVADSDPTFGFVAPGKQCGTEPQKHSEPGMEPGYEITKHLTFDGGIIRREVFEKIGLLNEDYYHYAADYEFVHTAQKAGFKTVWVHDVYAEHDWTPDAIPEWVEHDRPLYYSRWTRSGRRKTGKGKRRGSG